MFDADLFARSRAYVETTATPREALPAATGVSQAVLEAIAEEGAMPAPTYTLFSNAIVSPIATLGSPCEGEVVRAYFCPAVLGWLKHAALLQQSKHDTAPALEAAFAESFRSTLRRQVGDARLYTSRHLFEPNGELNEAAVSEEVRTLSADWMNGGWAVCLRNWDGHHVVTKEMERARIATITDDGNAETLLLSISWCCETQLSASTRSSYRSRRANARTGRRDCSLIECASATVYKAAATSGTA